MKKTILLIFLFSFFGCTSIYYVGEASEPVNVYTIVDTTSNVKCIIPIGGRVLTYKKSKKYYYIIYEGYKGYTYKPKYKNYHKYDSSIDGIIYGYSSTKQKRANSYNHTSKSSSNGSVKVKGYYRKNGNYVRPHVRKSHK